MRNRLVAVLAVAVFACFVALPSPAFASTYVSDKITLEEAAADYLGYDYMESLDLRNELGTHDDTWDYDNWETWKGTLTRVPSPANFYWVTSLEGFQLVNIVDKARADFERARARVNGGGFTGSGGGDFEKPDADTETETDPYANYLNLHTYISYNDSTPVKGDFKLAPATVSWLQARANATGHKYFIFAMSKYKVESNYLISFRNVACDVISFSNPPSITWNASKKRYVATLPDGTSRSNWCYCISTRGQLSGNFLSLVKTNNGSIGYDGTDIGNLRFVSDVIEFQIPLPDSPNTVPSGGVVNVYEGDTTNVTQSIDNSSTTVENSTTVYDSETNTYTTVNNITTNNTVDVSAITTRLDAINARVGQIGTDIGTMSGKLLDELDSFELLYYNGITTLRNQLVQSVAWLHVLDSDLKGIDRSIQSISNSSSGGSTDLTNIETSLSGISASLSGIDAKLDSSVSTSGDTDLSSVTTLVDDVESQLQTIADGVGRLVNGTPVMPSVDPTAVVAPVDGDESTIGERIGAKMEELSRRFPFSLPWDVQFVLSLLVRDPVPPEFDLAVIGSDDAVCHVDLSDWEPVAAVSRQGSVILFALGLALRTRQLVSNWGSSGD